MEGVITVHGSLTSDMCWGGGVITVHGSLTSDVMEGVITVHGSLTSDVWRV